MVCSRTSSILIGRPAPLHGGVRSSNHDRPLPTEEMHGSDRVPDLRDYKRAWVGKGKTINESEMALFSECSLKCARKVLDIADIATLSERRFIINHALLSYWGRAYQRGGRHVPTRS
jgi:hypothetical protein